MYPVAVAAAAVGIFCLLISSSLVSSTPILEWPFSDLPFPDLPAYVYGSSLFTKIDGRVVAQCSVKWDDGYTTYGGSLFLKNESIGLCYKCGPCTGRGIYCEKTWPCPLISDAELEAELSGSGSGGSGEIFI